MIKVGMQAPDFTLEDNKGGKVSLKDLAGKKVLLSWHPLAWTSVCTDQMRALEANRERFAKLNTVALGLSVDPAASKTAWASRAQHPRNPAAERFLAARQAGQGPGHLHGGDGHLRPRQHLDR